MCFPDVFYDWVLGKSFVTFTTSVRVLRLHGLSAVHCFEDIHFKAFVTITTFVKFSS